MRNGARRSLVFLLLLPSQVRKINQKKSQFQDRKIPLKGENCMCNYKTIWGLKEHRLGRVTRLQISRKSNLFGLYFNILKWRLWGQRATIHSWEVKSSVPCVTFSGSSGISSDLFTEVGGKGQLRVSFPEIAPEPQYV